MARTLCPDLERASIGAVAPTELRCELELGMTPNRKAVWDSEFLLLGASATLSPPDRRLLTLRCPGLSALRRPSLKW
jgi:hypothetical protein